MCVSVSGYQSGNHIKLWLPPLKIPFVIRPDFTFLNVKKVHARLPNVSWSYFNRQLVLKSTCQTHRWNVDGPHRSYQTMCCSRSQERTAASRPTCHTGNHNNTALYCQMLLRVHGTSASCQVRWICSRIEEDNSNSDAGESTCVTLCRLKSHPAMTRRAWWTHMILKYPLCCRFGFHDGEHVGALRRAEVPPVDTAAEGERHPLCYFPVLHRR